MIIETFRLSYHIDYQKPSEFAFMFSQSSMNSCARLLAWNFVIESKINSKKNHNPLFGTSFVN